jgi:hypothetical protein
MDVQHWRSLFADESLFDIAMTFPANERITGHDGLA